MFVCTLASVEFAALDATEFDAADAVVEPDFWEVFAALLETTGVSAAVTATTGAATSPPIKAAINSRLPTTVHLFLTIRHPPTCKI